MTDNSRAINRVFTRKVISDLVQDGKSDVFDYVVKRYVEDPSGKTHGQLISEIYTRLNQQQRNEYFYMNTLLNKLLCGIHNVNTTVAFSQVRIEHSIADFVMINGEGRVYEIKSDLDNFSRLHNQLQDYFCAFNKVSVLASIHEQEKVRDVLSSFGEMGEAVGIYVLSEQGTIFSPILEAQHLALQEMKKRSKITVEQFGKIRPELKAVVYFSNLEKQTPMLNQLLDTPYRR